MLFDRCYQVGQNFFLAVIIAGMLAVAGCNVRPLYQTSHAENLAQFHVKPDLQAKLAALVIDAPDDRFNQVVRNHLIFLLHNGERGRAAPSYRLTLNTGYFVRSSVQINIGDLTDRTGRASVGSVIAHSDYILSNQAGKVVAKNKRSVASSFDRPRQEYANMQAEEEAQNRAAEELAEQVFLSLVQDVAKNL